MTPSPSVTYHVSGMHCASCSSLIERTIGKLAGVATVSANYAAESMSLTFDGQEPSTEQLAKTLKPLGYELVLPKPVASTEAAAATSEKNAEVDSIRNKVIVSMPLVAVSALFMGWDILGGSGYIPAAPNAFLEFMHHVLPLMATYMLFVVGLPYLLGVFRFFRHGAASMDTLIGLGTSAAYFFSFALGAFDTLLRPYLNTSQNYYDVTIIVIGFITLGKFLEARAKLRTGGAIEALLGLQAITAILLEGGQEREIPVEQVVAGNVLVIRPGSRIPVDGVVKSGHSFVDEAMVSGEPVPVEKQIASQVIGGTLNTDGSFTMEATKVGSETVLAHIIDMVAKAQGSKAPVQRLADQISAIFVPVILVVAVIALGLWLLLGTPAIGLESALTYGLSSFVGILVIACPCALGLATPTAIIVGIGKGAGAGILIKDATTLEKLSKINTLVVDKTGTITRGAPELIDLTIYEGNDETEALELLASLENRSEHPIGRAIVNAARQRGIAIGDVKDFSIIKGQGLVASRGREIYYAGNAKLMAKLGHKIDSDKVEQRTLGGDTPVFLATRKSLLALAFVADAVKPEAALAVAELKALGLHLVMLSGDNPNTARHVADLVGIGDVIAEGSPEVKLMEIKKLQALGRRVAMAGDGVNDAPALAQADVGIAMGTGTDVAIGAAGLTLLHGDISRLVKAVKLSRSTMTAIHQNLFWAFSFNLTGIPLAAGLLYPKWGLLLSPAFAGAAMAFSSVAVVSNSLRLKLSGVR